MVEAFGIALQEGDGSQRALLGMEVFGLVEFQQRRDVVCAGWIKDDHALALLERSAPERSGQWPLPQESVRLR